MDMIKETKIPDTGWTQHYNVVKELGDCHASVGNFREAQKCYEKAASLSPDEAGPYIGIGVIALQEGKMADAEVAFKVSKRLDPQNSKAYCGLAMIRQNKGQWSKSFELYLKCLELDSDNLTALLGLFQMSCQMGSFSKVIHYLEVYLDMHPGDASVMFCLATLHFKDGRVHEAREILQRILAQDANNTDVADLLEEVEHTLAKTVV